MYRFPALYHRLHEKIVEDTDSICQIITEHFGNRKQLNILELGCGTGRVAHALANIGTVFGLDRDCSMLEFARSQYKADQDKGRLTFLEGSFPDFPQYLPSELSGLWDALVLPLNTMSHLTSQELLKLFEVAYRELNSGGLLIAGVLNPREELEVLCNGDLTFEFNGLIDGIAEKIELYEASKFLLNKKLLETTWYYYLGGQEVIEEKHLLHLYSKADYESLAKKTSFSSFEFYGDYGRTAWSKSSKIIFMVMEK